MYFYDSLNDIKHFLAYNFQEFRDKMKYKKTIILLALVVFLLSIAGVSASEIGDTIASENANTIELSTDNNIEDNLQTSEENEALASTDYDEAIAQTDTEVLGADSAKYSDLANEINQSGNIKLNHKNYTYDEGAKAITISEDNKVIDGDGAVIDMAGSTIRAFYISGSGVTIKNLTIKNANYKGDGGAICFYSTGTVSNCNFVDNKATDEDSWGGAIRMYSGSVENCNFTNNTAGEWGGAIMFEYTGTVSNCNFADNTAGEWGGAILMDSGNVTNCYFADNSAYQGGAILSVGYLGITVDTCIFKTGSDTTYNTRNLPPTLNVDNFTTVYGSGEKLTFDLKTNSSIPVTNGNISISVYFKDNGEWVRNYTCLSGEGWIPDLPVGSYIAVFNTEYAEFQRINRTITINKVNSTITLDDIVLDYGETKNVTVTTTGATGITAKIGESEANVDGFVISIPLLDVGNYTLTVTTIPDDDHNPVTKDIKVTVKKATPKLTAKKKTFKTTPKTKKYTIVLKDNTGKAIKKAKVTLKVKGKTYKATTNSKGKATFKITKLNKKGTFKATVTYKGNKYFNKVSKKAKIKVIVTFKTVSKGSKDKATVKEIQQALKDKGYYLTYQGHYLKVDGKFSSCTFRSVKEFQHDKGLKVTGKVDEKTAKKLGLI